MRCIPLPSYHAVRALQWITGTGTYSEVRPGWYHIRPVIVAADGRPWPDRTPWPAQDNYRPELELMLQ